MYRTEGAGRHFGYLEQDHHLDDLIVISVLHLINCISVVICTMHDCTCTNNYWRFVFVNVTLFTSLSKKKSFELKSLQSRQQYSDNNNYMIIA